MKIEKLLCNDIQNAIKTLYGQEATSEQVQPLKTKRDVEGHLTLVVFPLLKISRKKPEDTADEIGRYLVENTESVSAYNVVKGFLNLTIAP